MKSNFFVLLLVLLSGFQCIAQNLRSDTVRANFLIRKANRSYDESAAETDSLALLYYTEARDIYEQHHLRVRQLFDAYTAIGAIYYDSRQYEKALKQYHAALAMAPDVKSVVKTDYFYLYNDIIETYLALNSYDSALYYYDRAEQIIQATPNLPGIAYLYNLVGILYHSRGNYRQSINYFNKAVNIFRKNRTKHSRDILVCNVNISDALCKLGRQREGLEIYKQVEKSISPTNSTPYEVSILYQNVGKAYLDLESYDTALRYMEQAKQTYQAAQLSNKAFETKLLNNMATAYLGLHKVGSALFAYSEAIRLNQDTSRYKNTTLAKSHLGRGQLYEKQNNLKRALQEYQAAIKELHFSFAPVNIYSNPAEFKNAVSPLHLFEALKYKADALKAYYAKTRNRYDLQMALQTYQFAIALADYIRRSYDSDEAKLFFTDIIYPIYEEAIGCAFRLYGITGNPTYTKTAFKFAENSKAAILSEMLRNASIKEYVGLPPDLLKREQKLKEQITLLTTRIATARKANEVTAYKRQLGELEIQLNRTITEFEKYPEYYRLKYDTSSVEISDIQQEVLDNETAMIEYFLGEKHLYAFFVSEDFCVMKAFKVDRELRKNLRDFKKTLSNTREQDSYKGDMYGIKLYDKLIRPFQKELSGMKRLVIVPDAELNFVSFDALISDASQRRYLLYDYAISHVYSSSFLFHAMLKQKKEMSGNTTLALAPFVGDAPAHTTRDRALSPLPASKDEVEEIGGSVYLASEATKSLFLDIYQDYTIIHLATHASADDKDPLNSYIAFYPKDKDSVASYKLYAHELYNLHLESIRLLVLSACETGSGKLINGEGTLSLARAFAYAGCPSIVMTLWKADDHASAFITTRMHKYLKEGYAKDIALQQAKIDYISEEGNVYDTPNYWANFVFIGDYTPIYKKPFDMMYVYIVLTIAVIVAATVYRRSRIRRNTDL